MKNFENISSKSSLMENSLYNLSSKIIVNIVSILFMGISARLLKKEEMAIIAFIYILPGVITLFANLGFRTSIIKLTPKWHENDNIDLIKGLYKVTFVYYFAICLLIHFIIFIFRYDIYNIFMKSYLYSNYMTYIIFTSFIQNISELFVFQMKGIQNFKILSLSNIISNLSSKILGLGLFYIFKFEGYLIGTIIGIIAGLIINFAILKRYIFSREKFYPITKLIKYSFSYYIMGFTRYAYTSLDSLLIGILYSPEILALYFVATKFYEYIKTIIESVLDAAIPKFSQLQDNFKNLNLLANNIFQYLTIIVIPICFGIFAVSEFTLYIYGGSKYLDASNILKLLMVLCILYNYFAMISGLIFAMEKPSKILKLEVLMGSIALIFMLINSRFFGPSGIVIAKIVAFIICIFYGVLRINDKIKIEKRYLINALKFIVSAIFMSIIVIVINRGSSNIYLNIFSIVIGALIYLFFVINLLKTDDISNIKMNLSQKMQSIFSICEVLKIIKNNTDELNNKILLFTGSFLPKIGGAEMVIYNIANKLCKKGFDVCVLCGGTRHDNEIMYQKYDIKFKVIRFPYGFKFSGFLGLNIIISSIYLIYFILVKKYKLIHTHFTFFPGYTCHLLKKILSFDYILTPHGQDIQKLYSINYGIRLNSKIEKKVFKAINSATIVTSISSAITEELYNVPLMNKKRIVSIPNGFDKEIYSIESKKNVRELFNLPSDAIVLISVGRNHIKKNYSYSIKAISYLKNICNEEIWNKVYYIIIGSEVTENQNTVDEFFLTGKVILSDPIIGENLVDCYKTSNIFLNPSLIESFGLVNVEAMASGLPSIVTNVSGNNDVINDNVGFLVDIDNPYEMAEKINYLLNNLDKAKSLGKNGIIRSSEYSWDVVVNTYIEVYKELNIKTKEKLSDLEYIEKKIKILFIAPNLKLGGMERQLANLINGIDKKKYDIYLCLFNNKIEYEIDSSIKIFDLKKRKKIDIVFIFRLMKAVLKFNPQIIQSCISGVNLYTMLISWALGYKNIILSIRSTKLYREYKLLKNINKYHKINKIITNSYVAKSELNAHANLQNNVINVIHNGIDISRFSKKEYNSEKLNFTEVNKYILKQKKFIIGIVGRITPAKNHSVVIEALKFLKENNTLPQDLCCIFIGNIDDKSILEKYKNILNDNNLNNYILFEDKKDDIEYYYNYFDVFCLPSIYEGLPNVVLEAMGCEKPVIISMGANNDSLIKNMKNGWIFETHDYVGLANIILNAYKMPQYKLEKIRKENRKIILKKFMSDNLVRKMEQIYNNMVEN